MNPFFSVIIPTYNRAQELKRAILSVLEQTFTDFEILVMDDGSTDDTQQVVEAFKDKRIIYEWDINYGGPARPRNRGLSKAKGQWICFLDADDYWMSNKLKVCKEKINLDIDVIYHPLRIVGNTSIHNKENTECRSLKRPILHDLVYHGNAITNSSAVVRKSILNKIGGIDESYELISCEDYNTWMRIAEISDKFLAINQVLGYYSVHQNNISSKDMFIPEEYAVRKYMHLLTLFEQKRKISYREYSLGRRMYSQGNLYNSVPHLMYAVKYGLFSSKIKSIFMLILVYVKQLSVKFNFFIL